MITKTFRILAVVFMVIIHVKSVAMAQSVTVKGLDSEYLDSYFEGVASVYQTVGNIEYIYSMSQEPALDMPQFLYSNSKSSILKFHSVTNGNLETYDEGARFAAQLYYIDNRKLCIPNDITLTHKDIYRAIESKFTGEFETEYLNILVVGAYESLSEQFPCR